MARFMTLLRSWDNKPDIGVRAGEFARPRMLGAVCLLLAASAFSAVPTVVRGPYLQSGSATGLTVCWRTSLPTSSRVRYGTNVASLNAFTFNGAVVTNHFVS